MKSIVLPLAALATAVMAIAEPCAAWEPQKSIEFVVPYSAGGGSDTNARMLVEAIRKNNLAGQNFIVLNKPGGSGGVGNSYTFSKKGNGHTIMTFNSGQMMSTISNNAKVQLQHLTPLGTLAFDTLLLAVKSGEGVEKFADLVQKAKDNPKKVTIGGAARGSEDNLVFAMLVENTGAKFQYVPFKGGGEVLSALLGGHVDAGIFNPSEIAAQVEAARVKIIGSLAEKRLEKPFADAPTFIELGYPEVSFTMFRGYAGPPELPRDVIAYWEKVLEKASQTDEWKNGYVVKGGLIQGFLNASESEAFYEKEARKYRTLLKAAGFLE